MARGSECRGIHYTCRLDLESAFTLRGAEGVDRDAEQKRQTRIKKKKEKEKVRSECFVFLQLSLQCISPVNNKDGKESGSR